MVWTAPRTWVAGETVTAAIMNTHVRDNLKALSDPRTAFTPALTNITIGNGTLSCDYISIDKLLIARYRFLAGTTTTYAAGNLGFALPLSKVFAAALSTIDSVGSGAVDNGTGATRRLVTAAPSAAGAATVNLLYEGGTVTNAAPFAMGTASRIAFDVRCEVA